MPPTPSARRNRDEVFAGHVSALAATDPELISSFTGGAFGDFAFDEVIGHDDLDARIRLMTQLAATIACQAITEFRLLVGAALAVGVTPVELKEVVYQAVPYVGMAKAIDFVLASNDVLREHGVELPLPGQSTTTRETRMAAGIAVQKLVVGDDAVDAMHTNARDDEKHIQRYLSGNCFGDTLTRTGLDLQTRELLTFSMLIALGGCEPQLAGHVRGNLNVGNDRATLLAVLTQLLPFIGYPRTLNGLRVLDEVSL